MLFSIGDKAVRFGGEINDLDANALATVLRRNGHRLKCVMAEASANNLPADSICMQCNGDPRPAWVHGGGPQAEAAIGVHLEGVGAPGSCRRGATGTSTSRRGRTSRTECHDIADDHSHHRELGKEAAPQLPRLDVPRSYCARAVVDVPGARRRLEHGVALKVQVDNRVPIARADEGDLRAADHDSRLREQMVGLYKSIKSRPSSKRIT